MVKFALPLLAAFSVSSFAAQLNVLPNYNKETRAHDPIIYSTTAKPTSAGPMLSEVNGVCFVGSIDGVTALLQQMLDIYAAEVGQSAYTIASVGTVAQDQISIQLNYSGVEDGRLFKGTTTWDVIHKCSQRDTAK